jgi:transposase
MEVLYQRCCGLDVHKLFIVACLIVIGPDGKRHKEIRRFGTMTGELLALVDWLQAAACTHVALESTGVFWKPVYNLLEGLFEVLLVNAQHMRIRSRAQDGHRGCRVDCGSPPTRPAQS